MAYYTERIYTSDSIKTLYYCKCGESHEKKSKFCWSCGAKSNTFKKHKCHRDPTDEFEIKVTVQFSTIIELPTDIKNMPTLDQMCEYIRDEIDNAEDNGNIHYIVERKTDNYPLIDYPYECLCGAEHDETLISNLYLPSNSCPNGCEMDFVKRQRKF